MSSSSDKPTAEGDRPQRRSSESQPTTSISSSHRRRLSSHSSSGGSQQSPSVASSHRRRLSSHSSPGGSQKSPPVAGSHRQRQSSHNSSEESEPTTPSPISPTKQFFKFFSPKKLIPKKSPTSEKASPKELTPKKPSTSEEISPKELTPKTSPTSEIVSPKKLTPKKPSATEKSSPKKFFAKKPQTWDKFVSPKSSTRPILSSQCSGKSFDAEVSPIIPSGNDPRHVLIRVDEFKNVATSESRFDFGSFDEEKIIPSFFSARTCYDAMPKSGKVIVLSTELLVKNAFSCLVTNEIRAAPLWESSTMTFIGLLTISDFINVLRHYYYTSQDDIKDIENQKIVTWRKITNVTRPIIKVSPTDSLVSATKLLIEERIHRLPVFDEKRNSVMFVLTRKRLLQYLHHNLMERFGRTNLKVPSFWKKSIGELKSQIGTWENIATVSINTKVIEALDLFCERQVSSLPVMDEDNKLVDIFAKFDVFALAKEQTYDNLDMTVSEALGKAEVHEDVFGFTLNESLGTVIERFVNTKVHRLVVIDEKRAVIGMLSLSDILKFLVLQSLDDTTVTSDTIDEAPEGAIGGQDDSSVFLDSDKETSGNLPKSSNLEKRDSSDLSEDISKMQLEGDATEPMSEASASEEVP